MIRALALIAALALPGCAAYDNADIIQPAGTTALGRFSAITLSEIDQAIAVADTAAMAGAKDAAGLKTCLVKLRGYVEIVHGGTSGATSPVATAALLYLMRNDAKAALDQCGEVLKAA